MRVGIIQSNYVPWRGYFDFIDDVDLFVFYDDVPFGQGKKWRNRNQIKTEKGLSWLTVPLRRATPDTLIQDMEINHETDWQGDHVNKLLSHYRKAPFLHPYVDQFADIVASRYRTISELNVTLCKWVMKVLDIHTETKMSHEFQACGDKRDRPIDLLSKAGATTYVSGPAAAPYTDLDLYRAHGIGFEYKSYDYEVYPQLWGAFEASVTVLDLILNTGPAARTYLKSITPNVKVIP
jgi:hypothetical protein